MPSTKAENSRETDVGEQVSIEEAETHRFSHDEEAELLKESLEQKAAANTLFTQERYSEAIGGYDKALGTCPNYLDYEIAVLKSNIAACHLRLEDWKAAVESATASINALDRLEPQNSSKEQKDGKDSGEAETQVVEFDEDEDADEALAKLKISDQRADDINRIKSKALWRRGRAKSELGGWANLSGAEEDFTAFLKIPDVPPYEVLVAEGELNRLPDRIKWAKEREMKDMMEKLKELGNGILKPFGLSTDMFKMQKDEATGGYNMSFDQGR